MSPHSYGSSGVGSWNQDVPMSTIKMEDEDGMSPVQKTNDNTVKPDIDSSNNNPASPEDPIETDSDINDLGPHQPMTINYSTVRNVTPHPIKKEISYATSPTRPTVLVSPRSQPYPIKNSKLTSVSEENSSRENEKMQHISLAPVYYVSNIYQTSFNQNMEYKVQPYGTSPHFRAVSLEERPYRELSPLVSNSGQQVCQTYYLYYSVYT